jgi:hypothetical protein
VGDDKRVNLIGPADRSEGQMTPGMRREQAASTDRSWAGQVTTEAGMVSGWHHHGELRLATEASLLEMAPRWSASPRARCCWCSAVDYDLSHLVAKVGRGCHGIAPYLLLGFEALSREPPWSMHDDRAVKEVIERPEERVVTPAPRVLRRGVAC